MPTLSSVGDSGNTPCVDQRPTVVLRPKTPHRAAGRRIDPPVSLPKANAQSPAATATADPLLDPPGRRATAASHGFFGVPLTVLVPAGPKANSTVLVLPRMTHPACRSCRTTGPSASSSSSRSAADGTVVGMASTV